MPTKINWTNETWNPVTGCSKVSAACKFCYAERDWERLSANPKTVYFGRKFTNVQCHPERLEQPLRWTKPRMIFVNSMSDLFHPDVSFEFIDKVFAVMALAKQHTFQILTKRPERMLEYYFNHFTRSTCAREASVFTGKMDSVGGGDLSVSEGVFPLPNLWIGVSVENQATADERIPLLLQMPAVIRWISAEPLLGALNLEKWTPSGYVGWQCSNCKTFFTGSHRDTCPTCGKVGYWSGSHIGNSKLNGQPLDWVVVGGESGPKARPMHPDWTYSLRDQCKEAGVPFFFKQWGEWIGPGGDGFGTHPGKVAWIDSAGNFLNPPPQDENADCLTIKRVGKKVAGRLLGGQLYDEFPV